MPSPTAKSFATGHYDVVIDDERVSSYVKGVEGGLISATMTEEGMGPYHLRKRHLATREIEPLSIEFGASAGGWALRALEQFISRREHRRYTGHVIHGDINFDQQYEYTFERALLTEVSLPKLDAKGKDFASIKVKLQPEIIHFGQKTGPKIQPQSTDKQKMWTTSAFRLDIHGVNTDKVTTIDSLTFKLGTKAFLRGGMKLPEYVPTKFELPKLVFTIPMMFAGEMIDWFQQAVAGAKGLADTDYEKEGAIEFLDQRRKETIYQIDLFGLAPLKYTVMKSEANKTDTMMCKFELYITRVAPVVNMRGFL